LAKHKVKAKPMHSLASDESHNVEVMLKVVITQVEHLVVLFKFFGSATAQEFLPGQFPV